MIKRRTMKLGG